MKRFFSCLLAVVLLISSMGVTVFATEPNQTATVNISVTSNPGIASLNITLNYNQDALELVSITQGSAFSGGMFTANAANGKIAYMQTNNTTATGTLAVATFKVKENAALGTYNVTVSVTKCTDEAAQAVSVGVSGGSVTVTAPPCTNHIYGSWQKYNADQHKRTCTNAGCTASETASHSWNLQSETAATCGKDGSKVYSCSVCGETKTTTVSATGNHTYTYSTLNDTQHKATCSVCNTTQNQNHTWNSGTVTKAATCAETGIKTYTCTVCNGQKQETIAKTNDHNYGSWTELSTTQHQATCKTCNTTKSESHTWDNGTVTKAATCAETGIKTFKCTACSGQKTETIAKTTNHNYGSWTELSTTQHQATCKTCNTTKSESHTWDNGTVTKAATCAETGIKTYKCTACSGQKTETIAKTTDHNYGSWTELNSTQHQATCKACNTSKTESHTWNSGTVTKAATCAETGIKTFKCTACSAEKTEAISKLTTHTYGAWEKVDENNHKHTCTVSGCNATETKAHSWDAGKVTTEATCAKEGVKTFTCSDCKATKTSAINKLTTHTYGAWEKADDNNHKHTCTVSGCNATETKAHSWDAGKVTTEATCAKEGVKTFTCSDCKATKTSAINKLTTHTYGDWVKDDNNNHKHTCTVSGCNATETKAHKWDAGKVTTEATCSKEGEKTFTCSDCKATKVEAIKVNNNHEYKNWTKVDDKQHEGTCECGAKTKKAHNWDNGKLTTLGSCTEDGEKTFTCADCKATKVEAVKANGEHVYGNWVFVDENTHSGACACGDATTTEHEWDEGVATEEATCGQEGVMTYTCEACAGTKTETIEATGDHDYSVACEDYGAAGHLMYCQCGENILEAHVYTIDGAVIAEATSTSYGKQEKLCFCGAKTEVSIPMIPEEVVEKSVAKVIVPVAVGTVSVVSVGAIVTFLLKRKFFL